MTKRRRSRPQSMIRSSGLAAPLSAPRKLDDSGRSPRKVIVLGAGVDIAYRLPTIAGLAHELAAFSRGDGSLVDKTLRRKLPHLRFTFDKYAGDQSNVFLNELFTSNTDTLPVLVSAVKKLRADPTMAPIGNLISQLCEMAKSNQLSAKDLTALANLSGQDWEVGQSEPILDPQRLTLTQLPGDVLRTAFREAMVKGEQLSEHEREVLALFVEATSNVEQLISTYFMLFSAGRSTDQKTYLYLVWMLWAFLRSKSVNRVPVAKSLYSVLPSISGDIITFNYTNFFTPTMANRVMFFHGRLDQYLRVDDRRVVSNDPGLDRAIDIESIAEFLEDRRFDLREPSVLDLPYIVPPTSFKPVLSREQLRTWVRADDAIQNATIIVVVGYSFATADEHFNDLLRQSNNQSRILVVNPDLGAPLRNVCRVLGINPDHLESSQRSGCERRALGRLIYVGAVAEVVSNEFIDEMSR